MKKQIRNLIERNRRHATETAVPFPVRCSICALPVEKRQAVNNLLTEEDASLSDIARQLGIARASVWRHAKNHLMPQAKKNATELVLQNAPAADSDSLALRWYKLALENPANVTGWLTMMATAKQRLILEQFQSMEVQ